MRSCVIGGSFMGKTMRGHEPPRGKNFLPEEALPPRACLTTFERSPGNEDLVLGSSRRPSWRMISLSSTCSPLLRSLNFLQHDPHCLRRFQGLPPGGYASEGTSLDTAFLLTVGQASCLQLSFFAYSCIFQCFAYNLSFFAYGGSFGI